MLFNSITFIIFFIIFISTILLFPGKYWKYIVIIFSSFFYGYWDPKFLVLLYFVIFTTYISSIYIHNNKSKKILILQISIIILILCIFKYFNFFSTELENNFNIDYSPGFKKLINNIILPIGISFYSFQCISYLIDTFKGQKLPKFVDFFFFIIFFPQIIAGPILRSKNFIPQIKRNLTISKKNIKKSLIIILYGYFLKIGLADNLALYVDRNLNDPEYSNGISTLISIFFYNFQIYGDFCGYSLIAIGISKLFGFNIPANFNNPYFANSFKNFWQRWHISLSSFIRDYLYIPLGGSRTKGLKTYTNIVISMSIAGLWHGASLFFLLWGLLHSFYIILEKIFKKYFNPQFYKILVLFLIMIAWIPFRVNNQEDIYFLFINLIDFETYKFAYISNKLQFLKGIILITFLIIIEYVINKKKLIRIFQSEKKYSFSVIVLILLIIFFGNFDEKTFIYFQF